MTERDRSDWLAGTAYTVGGAQIHVYVDVEEREIGFMIEDQLHRLNLGHLEQLDAATRRALGWLALHPPVCSS